MTRRTVWALTTITLLAACCMLGLYQTGTAAPPKGSEIPFVPPAEQRVEMVNLLREIRDALKEQNELLRSGSLRVVITLPEKKEPQEQPQEQQSPPKQEQEQSQGQQ